MTKIKKVIENCFLRNKIIDKLIKYHIDKQKKLNNIKEIADKYINDYLDRQKKLNNKIEELKKIPIAKLVQKRYDRFRNLGEFSKKK